MASRRLFLAPFVSVCFKGQIGKLVSSSFLKRGMKNTLDWHFLLSNGPVWLQSDLAPFVPYREQSKISSQVAVRSVSPLSFQRNRANIFLQTKERLCDCFRPLWLPGISPVFSFELLVCLGPWELMDRLFGKPELEVFFLITESWNSSFLFQFL